MGFNFRYFFSLSSFFFVIVKVLKVMKINIIFLKPSGMVDDLTCTDVFLFTKVKCFMKKYYGLFFMKAVMKCHLRDG